MPTPSTTVRMFGALHAHRRESGLSPTAEVNVPPEGRGARALACDLDLPLEKIKGVFVNHRACTLDQTVHAGDRVAFIPVGTPGTECVLLGLQQVGPA